MNIETFDIKDFIDNYKSDNSTEREGRRKDTNEVFTPFEIVENMCAKIDDCFWGEEERTFLEPSFGTGNILLFIIWKRLASGVSWRKTLMTLFGIELMPDNVKEAKARIIKLLKELQVIEESDIDEAMHIMNKHLVCTDFFDWDFENWKPLAKQEAPGAISLF